MKVCERCGGQGSKIVEGPFAGSTHSLDYCAVCSKDLCDECMKRGCCGNVPAKSGLEEGGEAQVDDTWKRLKTCAVCKQVVVSTQKRPDGRRLCAACFGRA